MKNKAEHLTMIIEVTPTGFSAYAIDHPIFTTGANLETLQDHAREAAALYFSDSGKEGQLPSVHFEADLKPLFARYPYLDARKMAEKLGISARLLIQYASGRKFAPLPATRSILNGLRAIGKELVSIG